MSNQRFLYAAVSVYWALTTSTVATKRRTRWFLLFWPWVQMLLNECLWMAWVTFWTVYQFLLNILRLVCTTMTQHPCVTLCKSTGCITKTLLLKTEAMLESSRSTSSPRITNTSLKRQVGKGLNSQYLQIFLCSPFYFWSFILHPCIFKTTVFFMSKSVSLE